MRVTRDIANESGVESMTADLSKANIAGGWQRTQRRLCFEEKKPNIKQCFYMENTKMPEARTSCVFVVMSDLYCGDRECPCKKPNTNHFLKCVACANHVHVAFGIRPFEGRTCIANVYRSAQSTFAWASLFKT